MPEILSDFWSDCQKQRTALFVIFIRSKDLSGLPEFMTRLKYMDGYIVRHFILFIISHDKIQI